MTSAEPQHPPLRCPCCLGRDLTCAHIYTERPQGETVFSVAGATSYYREIWQCSTCGHYLSMHGMDLSALYAADYVDSTYGGLDGIRRHFERIMAMDPAKSDNAGRVSRVVRFAQNHFGGNMGLRVLDIGSGLGVFLARLKQQTDWVCTALEPDPRFAQHARQALGVEAIAEDYMKIAWNRQFDLITLNKVLEHVPDPLVMLERCVRDLAPGGMIYVELPDAECAADDPAGFGREEFFIEHHHAFSMASLELLTRRAGLRSISLERLREPSGKYTLRSFLRSATTSFPS